MAYYQTRKKRRETTSFIIAGIVLAAASAISLPLTATSSSQTMLVGGIIIGLLTIIGAGFLLFYLRLLDARRLRALRLADIDTMKGVEFERYVAELL